jgi:hypothetical protein
MDSSGRVVVIEVKRDIDRGQLAQCLEYAGWARSASLDELGSLYRDVVVIPKSVRRDRMAENFAVFDFTLTDAELARITTMDTDTGLFVDHEDPETVEGFAKMRGTS